MPVSYEVVFLEKMKTSLRDTHVQWSSTDPARLHEMR